jgi:hypothetical protein
MSNLPVEVGQLDKPSLSCAVRTLVCGGYLLDKVERKPGYSTIVTHKYDEFGCVQQYCFVLAEDSLNETQISAARIAAAYYKGNFVVIGQTKSETGRITWKRFINLFGGPVFSSSPLEPEFRGQLIELSFDRLPVDMLGEPDDLFEKYVKTALEFILGGPVIPYGQEKRFEAKPDGVALSSNQFCALYDAKAYGDGYRITINQIRQFKEYVKGFNERYESHMPKLNSFIVISGRFSHTKDALEERSRDFLAETSVPLSFLTSDALVEMIELMSHYPQARRAVKWARVFAEPVVKPSRVSSELKTIKADRIV